MSIYQIYPYDIKNVTINLPKERVCFEELMKLTGLSDMEVLRHMYYDPEFPKIELVSFPTYFRKDVERYMNAKKKRRQ